MGYKYMLATKCLTYNHAPYINDALRGFAIQKTSFPCVFIVIDDASTDGEPELLRKWAKENLIIDGEKGVNEYFPFGERYVACLKDNPLALFIIILLSENHHGKKSKTPYFEGWLKESKYQALCEGDDFWIDPMKLQKQVDYMEEHKECSLCFTGANVVFDNGFENVDVKEYKSLYANLEERDYDGTEILQSWVLPTASIIYKNSITIKIDKRFMFWDIIVGLSAAEQGSVHCIPEKMVVYRRNSHGMSAKPQPLSRSVNHYKAIGEVFGKSYEIICRGHITRSIASTLLTGDKEGRRAALKIIKESPSYLPSVLNSMIGICVDALKSRMKG